MGPLGPDTAHTCLHILDLPLPPNPWDARGTPTPQLHQPDSSRLSPSPPCRQRVRGPVMGSPVPQRCAGSGSGLLPATRGYFPGAIRFAGQLVLQQAESPDRPVLSPGSQKWRPEREGQREAGRSGGRDGASRSCEAGTGLPRCFQEEPALRRPGVGPMRQGQTCDLPWVFCYVNEPESKAYILCILIYKTF